MGLIHFLAVALTAVAVGGFGYWFLKGGRRALSPAKVLVLLLVLGAGLSAGCVRRVTVDLGHPLYYYDSDHHRIWYDHHDDDWHRAHGDHWEEWHP